MITYQIAPGTTDVSVVLRIIDSTDGTPETGVVFNTSGIDLEYRREGEASTDITEATLAALTTAHTDGGFLHIGNGLYRLDLPDAACAAGSAGCLVHGTVTGMVVIPAYIQLAGAVNKIYSDTTIIYSDTTIATSKAVQIYSDTSIIYSDTTIATSKATQIYSDTTIIYSDTTRIHSDTTILTGPADGTAGAFPEVGIIDQGTAQSASATGLVLRSAAAFADDTLIGATLFAFGSTQGYWQERLITDNALTGDTVTVDTWTVTPSGTITYKIFGTAPGSSALTAAQDSKLTRVNSKATQIYSDTTIIYSDTTVATSKATQIYSDTAIASSKAVQIYSDTTIVYSDTTMIQSKATQIYSDTTAIEAAGGSLTVAQDSKLTRVNSKATQIYSDTAIIYSDTTIATSKATQIYSDTTAVHSDTTAVHSDTTAVHSDTTAIQTKTDSLTFTQAGHVDANIQRINDVAITGNGGTGTEFNV